jgi:ankyrin repeat protein
VQTLLAKKSDVNATQPDGATALHWAAYTQDAETVAQLIRAGANVNVRNNYGISPLALAAEHGNANIIGQLMKAGADPNDPINYVNSADAIDACRARGRRRGGQHAAPRGCQVNA